VHYINLPVYSQVIRERRARTKRWISSSIPESQWTSELALYSSADYHVNNLVSPVLFQEALEHVPGNAIVIEIAPHSLLQAVLRRALSSTCTVVGLMDKRQPDNLVHLLATLGKYVVVSSDVDLVNGNQLVNLTEQVAAAL